MLLFPTESVSDLKLFCILQLFWGLSEADTSPSQGCDDVIATIINSSITDHFRSTYQANALLLGADANPWGDVGNTTGRGNKEHKANLHCSMYVREMKDLVVSWALKSVTL